MFGLVIIDFVFLFIILISIVIGVFKGFVRELISLFSFIAATYLAIRFFDDLTELFLIKIITNRPIASFLSFLFIFVFIIIIGSIIIYFVKKSLLPEALQGADKILGASFGLIRGMLICIVALFFIVNFMNKSEWVKESKMSPFFFQSMNYIIKLVPDKHSGKIDNFVNKEEREV